VRGSELVLFVGLSEEKNTQFTLEYFVARDSTSSWSLNFVFLFVI